MPNETVTIPRAPAELSPAQERLSRWWPRAVLAVLVFGYWHARGLEYTGRPSARLIEWLRTPGDLVFMFVGVLPALIAVTRCYFNVRRRSNMTFV